MVSQTRIATIAVILLVVGFGRWGYSLCLSNSGVLPGPVSILLIVVGAIVLDVWRKDPTPNHTYESLVKQYFVYRIIRVVGRLVRMKFNRMCRSCRTTQEKVLTQILHDNRNTRFFKEHGLDKLQTMEQFRKTMPLTTFANYESYIESIKETGEENVMFPGPTQFLGVTSGTTSGKSKAFPKHIAKYNNSMMYVVMMYDTMFESPRMRKMQRQVFVRTMANSFKSKSGIDCGPASLISYSKSNSPFFAVPTIKVSTEKESLYVHLLFGLADKFISVISAPFSTNLLTFFEILEDKWEHLCNDIERGSISEDVDISEKDRKVINENLEGQPARANELRGIFRNGFQAVASKLWPYCWAFQGTKTGVFSTAAQLLKERYLGDIPLYTWLHISTEALSGIVMELHPEDVHYVLVVPCCFFEFLPETDTDSDSLLMAHQVNVGETYEMVITTYDGLCRYRTEDMVEIVSFYGETPKYKFVRRAGDILSVNTEKVPEFLLRKSVYACAERGQWKSNIVEFTTTESIHVQNMLGAPSGTKHYIVFIELDNDIELPQTSGADIDQELCSSHEVYSAMRRNGKIEPIQLQKVRNGTFSLIKNSIISKNPGAFSAHFKMPRILRREDILDDIMMKCL